MVSDSSFWFEKVLDRWDFMQAVLGGFILGLLFASTLIKPYVPPKRK